MAEKDDGDTVSKLPSKRILQALLRQVSEASAKTSDINGTVGKSIKDAAEKHNLHPQAFKLIARLKRMDPVKLRGYLDHFDAYRDTLKVDDLKAKDIPGLIEGDEAGETEQVGDDDKIRRFPAAAGNA